VNVGNVEEELWDALYVAEMAHRRALETLAVVRSDPRLHTPAYTRRTERKASSTRAKRNVARYEVLHP